MTLILEDVDVAAVGAPAIFATLFDGVRANERRRECAGPVLSLAYSRSP